MPRRFCSLAAARLNSGVGRRVLLAATHGSAERILKLDHFGFGLSNSRLVVAGQVLGNLRDKPIPKRPLLVERFTKRGIKCICCCAESSALLLPQI